MAVATFNERFFYVNGVRTDEAGYDATREQIGGIVGDAVDGVHNDTATDERIYREAAAAVIAGIALCGAAKTENPRLRRAAMLVGTIALVGAVVDYAQMQQEKNEKANELAGRVSEHLDGDKMSTVCLIAHSQGADVTYRALMQLDKYRGRIRVITLGAMTPIPVRFAREVTNFVFSNDWVSKVMASPFGVIRAVQDPGERYFTEIKAKGIGVHAVAAYLEEKQVKEALTA